MKKILLFIAFFYGTFYTLYSQNHEDGVVSFSLPIRNSLKFNKFVINPTFSFVREQNTYVSFYNKKQWVQFDDAPQTYLASYSGRFGENEGIGFGLYQQNYGVLTTFGGVANFAHNVRLEEDSNLTFGMNVGFYKSGINQGKVISNDPNLSLDNIPSNTLITLNPGINYGTAFLDFGLSVNNLVIYNFKTSSIIKDDSGKSIEGHIMYTGYIDSYGFFDKSKFSALFKTELKKDKTVISGLMQFTIPKGIWAQAGYNTVYGMSAGIGLNITPRISLEYNFEKATGNLSNFGSSHEIVIAYKFKNKNKYNDEDDEGAIISPSETKTVIAKPKESTALSPEDAKKLKELKQALAAEKEEKRLQKLKEIADAKLAADVLAKAKLATSIKDKPVVDAKAKTDALAKAKLATTTKDKIIVPSQAKLAAETKAKADALVKEKLVAEAKVKADALAKEKLVAEAKAKADALVKEKLVAEAKAKADALAKEKQATEAKAKADALVKEKLVAEAKAKADAIAKEKLEVKAKEDTLVKEKQAAEAKTKADALVKEKLEADAKAKADALVKEKQATEAKAKADALVKEKLEAEAKAKADAIAKEKLEVKTKEDALAKEKQAAEVKTKADALVKEKLEAEAKAKADALVKEKLAAETKAKADALAKEKLEADAKAKADALVKEKLVAEAKAKADAIAKEKLEVKAKEDALTKEKQAAEAKTKADALAKEKLVTEAKAKADAIAKEKLEVKAKEDALAKEKLEAMPKDENAKSMENLAKLLEDSKTRQQQLLKKLDVTVADKAKDLKDLKEENDLSDKGIFKEPKPLTFKSASEERNEMESLKLELAEVNRSQNEKIKQLENLYKERLKKISDKDNPTNQYYIKTIEELKAEQLKVAESNTNLISSLEKIKVETEIEKKRRIKRAAFQNDQDRYQQDVVTLKRIKETTKLSLVPLKPEDFDYGDQQSDMQILKNIENVRSGYYLIVAVHSDVAKRDTFLTKAVAAGQSKINFFYDVNTSKYFIYYDMFGSIEDAKKAVESKGNKPYNGNMSIVKIEN